MLCQNCAQAIPDGTSNCAGCGFATGGAQGRSPAGEMTEKAAQQAKDAVGSAHKAFRILALNPVGGLRPAFESLLPLQVLQAGIVFTVGFALCFAIGARQIFMRPLLWVGGGDSWLAFAFKLMLVGLILVVGMVGAQFLARRAFRGSGSVEGDLFVASISLLPLGFLSLLAGLLGAQNGEVITVVGVITVCFCVLILHGGCRDISKINEPWASLAVPLILLVSGWLSSVMLRALM